MRHGILLISSYGIKYLYEFIKQFPKNDNDFLFFIHLHGLSFDEFNEDNTKLIKEIMDNYNIEFIGNIFNSHRFSIELAKVMINLLYISHNKCDYMHFMSDSCYIIRSIEEFKKKFENASGKSFMDFSRFESFQYKNEIQYKGSQWMSLHNSIVRKMFMIVQNIEEVISDIECEWKKCFNHIYLGMNISGPLKLSLTHGAPDEFVVQYLILKLTLNDDESLIKKYFSDEGNLRYINWSHCLSSPRILRYSEYTKRTDIDYGYDINDIDKCMFCRKIDVFDNDSYEFLKEIKNRYEAK